MKKEHLLMTIKTLHHFFFGHCVNPSEIVVDLSIFLRERKKNTSVQNNHLQFNTMTANKMVLSHHCLNHGLAFSHCNLLC